MQSLQSTRLHLVLSGWLCDSHTGRCGRICVYYIAKYMCTCTSTTIRITLRLHLCKLITARRTLQSPVELHNTQLQQFTTPAGRRFGFGETPSGGTVEWRQGPAVEKRNKYSVQSTHQKKVAQPKSRNAPLGHCNQTCISPHLMQGALFTVSDIFDFDLSNLLRLRRVCCYF